VNAFAALRGIHLKAENGSANAAPIIRESPSTSDSRGFEDPLATAELSNAFLAGKALQHDADLALRRRMPPRRGGCPSQTFPPAPSPAPGDGIGPEVMAEVEKIATRFTREGIVHFKIEKGLVGGAAYGVHKQRSAMPTWRARKRRRGMINLAATAIALK
jgi:hypothetical protein